MLSVKTWLYVACTVVLMFLMTSIGSAQSVNCSSEDGHRKYCPVDTRGGVRMVKQRSDATCSQGSTWGYDRGGIWVDRGCRADFIVGNSGYGGGGFGGGGYGGGYGGSGQTVNCSSEDGHRKYCPYDTRGGVRLINQRSGSPCTQGSTWGYDRGGIWVDRGCRADFQLGGGGYGGGGYGGGNHGGHGGYGGGNDADQFISCSSDDMHRHYCPVDARGGVRLVKQRSDAACRQGYSWGYDRRGIWVDRGCRADFQVIR